MAERIRTLLLLPALVLAVLTWLNNGSAQEQEPEYLLKYKQSGIPPLGDHIQFTDERVFPPQPSGLPLTEGIRPEVTDLRAIPNDRLISQSLTAALLNTKVRQVLGDRFAVLGGGPLEPAKGQPLPAGAAQTSLDFYSYSRNRAVTVLLSGDRVVDVITKPPGFQPPETREEVAAAAGIVKRDVKYAEATRDLFARGIQTSRNDNRQLYLLFYRQKGTPAVFQATVDMTLGRVVSAGPVTQ